ncbi:MAG: phage tail tape measure protein [Hyphomicrobiales bacterium]|nr:phage tail tape measure protein [Hyphomicrobiales bacterium]
MADSTDFADQDLARIRGGLDSIDLSAERVSRSLTKAFAGAVSSGKSFDDTLRTVALSLSKLALNAGMKPMQEGLSSLLGSLGSSVSGGGAPSMPVAPFAEGGVVSRPTFFGSGGGLGLMGERGAEAIMPLARGPDGRLGIAAGGAGQAPATVNVTINTPDAESFRRSQVQVTGALARAVARGRRSS